ncbi:MAG TPA: NAD(P)/FAD-dependent oxidoreductase, partial [Hyphomicrobiaceae bacterium]|nr:NAD(P)/FAD-dependent oxidoreductase [Hyphomicrobiaceae bacterium]
IGAGLMLQPTGLACLARVDLDKSALASGAVIKRIDGRTVAGRRIFDVAYAALSPRLFGLGIHRGTLFQILYDEVQRLHLPVHGAREIALSELRANGRTLIDRQGRVHGPFDLVVDATGTRSPLRAACGETRTDRPYAYGALWGIVEIPQDWPDVEALAQVYHGAHTMAGVLPVGRRPGDERQLAAVFWSLRKADLESWHAAGLDAWKASVLALWPALAPLLAQFRNPEDLTFATYADMTLRRRYAERLAFIGDAGRTTSPQLGQGCNLALIDATTLAAALGTARSIDEGLRAYDSLRNAHNIFYSRASRWLTPFFQSDSITAGIIRDATFPLLGRIGFVRKEMVRTLSGMKTGPFSHLDPGLWHADYSVNG